MRISDWSSDVCSSDLTDARVDVLAPAEPVELRGVAQVVETRQAVVERRLGRHDPAAGPPVAAVHRRVETETPDLKLGRAACRERVFQYVKFSVVAATLKKKTNNKHTMQTKKQN